jgi:uncharacterized protein
MNKLVIPLSVITDDGKDIDAELDADLVGNGIRANKGVPGGEAYNGFALGAVRVVGHVKAIDSEYLFRGTLSGAYTRPCDRCLVASSQPYSIDVVWFFEAGMVDDTIDPDEIYETTEDDAEEPPRCFSGTEIDLTEHVREEILLTAPAKFLCQEECNGLCPKCGANLNEGPCACAADRAQGHPAFSNLADLFPELRPTKE